MNFRFNPEYGLVVTTDRGLTCRVRRDGDDKLTVEAVVGHTTARELLEIENRLARAAAIHFINYLAEKYR